MNIPEWTAAQIRERRAEEARRAAQRSEFPYMDQSRAMQRQMERQIVNGPPEAEPDEIDPRTGAPMCRGKDVCDLEVCSLGVRAHGRSSYSDMNVEMSKGMADNLALRSDREQAAIFQQVVNTMQQHEQQQRMDEAAVEEVRAYLERLATVRG
jgi:hypothetical protein